MPSFEQSKSSKLWSVRFRQIGDDGKQHNARLSGFRTKKEAQRGYEDYITTRKQREEAKKEQQAQSAEANRMNMSFGLLISKYLEYRKSRVKESSYYDIENKINNRITPYFGHMTVGSITPNVILDWQKSLDDAGYHYSYKTSLFQYMSSIYKFGNRIYDIPDIMIKVDRPRNTEPEKEMHFWTPDEFRKFIPYVSNQEHAVMFWFLYVSGCRFGEADALFWDDIDLDAGTVKIKRSLTRKVKGSTWKETTPKNKSSIRTVNIPPFMCHMLEEHHAWQISQYRDQQAEPPQFVFGGYNPVPPTSLEHSLDNGCRQSGVKKIRIHDFRHSCASYLISNGSTIVAVSRHLGHKDIEQTLNTYSHLFPDDQSKITESLEKLGTK